MFTGQVKFEDQYLQFYATDKGLSKVLYTKESLDKPKGNSIISDSLTQFQKYLKGELKQFTIPLDPKGSEFQKKVWQELSKIPYGDTRTYKDIALKVGGANYSRAVGMANNKNPLPIIVPCHRVVGSNGSLTGYALGLNIKEKLLEIECHE